MFVPQMSPPANSAMLMSTGNSGSGSAGGGASYIGDHYSMNRPAMYHLRQMSSYQQQHQQQQRFITPSPPHHGYSYFQHAPRHYYNHSYSVMNHRPPQLPPPTHGGFTTLQWSKNSYNGQPPHGNQKQHHYYQKSFINTTEVSSDNNNSNNNIKPPTTKTNDKKQKEAAENSCKISTNDKNNNNEETFLEKPPQKQKKSENSILSCDPVWNVRKNPLKKCTKFPKLQRSDSKSSTKSSKTINKDVTNGEQHKSKNDTMQRNSSKASHTSTKSHHNNKHDSSDSGISTNGHQHHQHHHHVHNSSCSSTTAKQRKSRSSSKRQDAANNNNNNSSSTTTTANGQKRRGSSGFTVNDWLQNDMYCYERRFISSCAEDNMISRHNPAHRNSTSSEAAGSDDLNSSSSNEDLCTSYIIQTKSSKKSTKSRQKRQQKRKQNGTNNNNNISSVPQPMDIDEESKENQKPKAGGMQTSSTAAINLRKQCTKAAAFKAVLNNSKLPKCSGNALVTSASNSSVCSSLSSASSTSSINSSSASSSPTHSANSSPTASPTASKRNVEHLKKVAQSLTPPPLRQFAKLNLSEEEMVQEMTRYIIDPSLLRVYGFPVESVHHEGCIEIYKCLPKHLAEEAVTKDNQRHHRHFYGRKKSSVINAYDGLYSGSSSQQWYPNTSVDSGHGSGDSSPRCTDSDSSEMGEEDSAVAPIMAFYTPDGVYQIFSEYYNSVEKQCVRCSKLFQVNTAGEYMSFDTCTYHWGKLNNAYNGKCYVNIYSCCQGEEVSEGCSQHPLHVWNGAVVGINGPYNDFVHTKHKQTKHQKHPKLYAIDCEMSYTGLGLEVTKVTVVGYDGALVYEHFVRPQADIIDYNTRFSGIAEKDLSSDSNNLIKTFAEVQQDLLNLFDADTILIGHGLDNDLRVLRLVHKTIVDTSLIFSHSTGYPYRRSLKNLTKSFLKRDIQCGDMGHSSFEDSRACLELMMWKVRKDLRHWNYQ